MEWARLKFLGEQGKWPDFWRALTLSATLRALAVIKLFEEVSGGGGGGGSSSSENNKIIIIQNFKILISF